MRSLGNGIRNFYGQLTIEPPTGGGNPLSVQQTGGNAGTSFGINGNVTIAAPVSGNALTVNGVTGQNSALLSNTTSGSSFEQPLGLTNGTDSNMLFQISQVGAATKFAQILTTVATPLEFGTNNVTRMTIASTGAVAVNAPSSGPTLSVTGAANNNVALFSGSGTTGQSFGPFIQAGTNTSDFALRVVNAGGGSTFFTIDGAGNVNLPNGTSLGPAYSGVPVNTQTASYTTVLSDANKCIKFTGTSAATFTIAANSSVSYPVGTVITFANRTTNTLTIAINSDSLVYSNTGNTGSRTLGTNAMATAIKTDTTVWLISGAGIS
jgi:hypothetical protein